MNDDKTINGIDVSECPHYDKVTGCFHTLDGKCIKDKCSIYKLILKNQCLQEENKELRQIRKNSPDIQEPYIYLYRQIKKQCHKLEEENEELKKRQITKNGFICDCEQNVKYKQTLEEIRKKLKKYDANIGDTIIANPIQDCYDTYKLIDEVLK